MAATARSIRSNAAPAGREDERQQHSKRPELTVVRGRKSSVNSVAEGFERFLSWTKERSMPLLHVVIAVSFLVASLVGSLTLRTQMAQNSFEAATVQNNISRLSQDVEEDQATLDDLQASLPSKAQEMGMVPQQGSLSIDLNGYKVSEAKH